MASAESEHITGVWGGAPNGVDSGAKPSEADDLAAFGCVTQAANSPHFPCFANWRGKAPNVTDFRSPLKILTKSASVPWKMLWDEHFHPSPARGDASVFSKRLSYINIAAFSGGSRGRMGGCIPPPAVRHIGIFCR